MNNLFTPRKETRDNFDVFVLILIMGLTSFFSMNPLVAKADDTGLEIEALDTMTLSPFILFPLYVLFVLLSAYLIFSRYRQHKVLPNKILFIILLSFLLVRVISIFAIPYGNVPFSYVEPFNKEMITFCTSNAGVGQRFINFFNDMFVGTSLLLLASYIKDFNDFASRFILALITTVFVLLALVGLIYSYFSEASLWANNVSYFFSLDVTYFSHIRSFFGNRNVFGMFMLFASCLSLIQFFKKPHVLWLVLVPFFAFNCAGIFCRTSLFLIFGLSLATAIFYPVLHWKDQKKYSIAVIGIIVVMLLLLLITYLADRDLVEKWFSALTNRGTMLSRHQYTKIGLTMLSDPLYAIFGYGKPNFSSIFITYQKLIPGAQYPLWTTHLLYTEYLLQLGILGTLFVLFGYGYIVYYFVLHFKKKHFDKIAYLIVFGAFLGYGLSEMKGLFLLEGTSACFSYVLLVPFLSDSKDVEAKI